MAELRAPEQNRLLGQLANMLRTTEGSIAAPEFLPPQLDVMGLVRQLMLPSAETVEKLSYGDPLFRMPMQSNIPITADREYLADIAGMIPFGAPAARPTARGIQDLVRQIQTEPPTGAVTLQKKLSIQNLLPETGDEISAIADQIAEQAKGAGFRVKPGYSNVSGSQYVTIEKPIGEDEFKTVQVRISNHEDRYPGTAEGTRFSIDPSSRNTYEDAIGFLADEGFDITKPITKEATTFEQYVRNLGLDPNSLTPERLDTLQFTARREGISVGGLLDEPAQSVAEAPIQRAFTTVNPGDEVSGLTVREDVPNMSSIGATIENYEILQGIRKVPRKAFDEQYLNSLNPAKLDKRTADLSDEIKQSKEINPLIVAVDDQGAYIIEGGHRFDALMTQKRESVPAVVVIDKDNPPTEQFLQSLLD